MSATISPPASILPPGPQIPSWWQLIRFAGDPLGLLDECHRRYGDAFTLRIAGNGRFVMLSHPQAVREVFQADADVLHSGEANAIFKATVGSDSVLVLDGATHMRQRRVLVPPLKGERMRAFFDAIRYETLEAVRKWPVGAPFSVLPTMRRISLRVILRTGLGLAPGGELDRFEQKIERFLSYGRQKYALVLMTIVPIQRLSGTRWAPLFRQLSDLDNDLFAFIAARRRGEHQPAGQNVLDDLLAARHEDGTPLEDREVRDAIITILIAGHETTALALSWTLSVLARHPESVDRLGDEVRRVTGGGPPGASDVAALAYLEGVIRESLRLRPVVPFVVRKTLQPIQVDGHEYPAGVVLCPCSYLLHQREDIYPHPGAFQPERFLERKFGPQEWFPFGGGNRLCLGMSFALYEMKVVLATLLSQVRPQHDATGIPRARRYGIVLGPADGGRIAVSPSDAIRHSSNRVPE
jgi:cytochrome P450